MGILVVAALFYSYYTGSSFLSTFLFALFLVALPIAIGGTAVHLGLRRFLLASFVFFAAAALLFAVASLAGHLICNQLSKQPPDWFAWVVPLFSVTFGVIFAIYLTRRIQWTAR